MRARNTAPLLSKDECVRVLSSGVDTLEMTARGRVRGEVWEDLLALQRRAAENGQPELVELAGQVFLMQPYGWRNYGLWLRSHNFELMLGCNEHFPAARVEVSSSCLHALGPRLASELVESTLRCGVLCGEVEPKVSRIDLYCDVQGWPLRLDDLGRFVTRARNRRGHLDDDQAEAQVQADRVYASARGLTGLDFGRRGAGVYVRIYNKTMEIGRRGLAWLPDLWGRERLAGAVWRVEAELRRPVLVEHGLGTADEVLAAQQDLWCYVTGSWLTYRTPTGDDRKRRWPVDPVWQTVQSVELAPDQLGVVRGRIAEATEQQLVMGATGYLSSLAALHPEWKGLRETLEQVGPILRRYLESTGRTWPAEVLKKRVKRPHMISWSIHDCCDERL